MEEVIVLVYENKVKKNNDLNKGDLRVYWQKYKMSVSILLAIIEIIYLFKSHMIKIFSEKLINPDGESDRLSKWILEDLYF